MSTLKNFSKVCSCGKGYRSRHDLMCGHCRSRGDRVALQCYLQALADSERLLQQQYYGMYVPAVQPGDGSIDAEVLTWSR